MNFRPCWNWLANGELTFMVYNKSLQANLAAYLSCWQQWTVSPACAIFYGEKVVNWNHSLKAAAVSGQNIADDTFVKFWNEKFELRENLVYCRYW